MQVASKILIVDDEPYGREALVDILSSEPYELIVAENGYSALELAGAHLPDVILLDVMMPGMDGFTVCSQIRSQPSTAEIPVIMLTALDDRRSLLRGIEAGSDEFLSKPYDITELRTRVRTIVRLNRYRRLQQERSKFEQVVKQSETGYAIIDGEGRIQFANPSLCRFLHCANMETTLIGADFRTVVQEIYRCEPAEDWVSWPLPLPDEGKRLLIRPGHDGDVAHWLRVDVTSDLTDQVGAAWLISVTEITQIVEQQLNMFSFQRMVAHKLRTPVSVMTLASHMMEAESSHLSPAEVAYYAKTLYVSAHELSVRINDVIQYAEIHELAHRGSLVGLHEIGDTIYRIAQEHDVAATVIEDRVKPMASEHATLPLSSAAFELICGELAENARKFHPEHSPTLSVSLSFTDASTVMIEITDDGISLPENLISQNIGDPYYQYEPAFTGNGAGMGLGLASVKALVWSAGGNWEILNRGDRPGVTVRFQLPILDNPSS
jgi:two-component system, cell cycle response regulator